MYQFTQIVGFQAQMDFGESKFPWISCKLDGTERGGTSAAIITGDNNFIGISFGNPGGDSSYPFSRDKLNADSCIRIQLFEIKNKLCQVFYGVDIVMWWWRNQGDSRYRKAQCCNKLGHFFARKLSPFTGLCPLSKFDLDLFGATQIAWGDPEST